MHYEIWATAMRTRRIHNLFPLGVAVLVVSLACISAGQQADIQIRRHCGNLDGMRLPNFSDYGTGLQKFLRAGGSNTCGWSNAGHGCWRIALVSHFSHLTDVECNRLGFAN